ncbi:MAG: hypothetical protein M1819_004235 [Sarea resinae]|nr:MAG: hypothetical protein M1819_004235 [Sarea resinae]
MQSGIDNIPLILSQTLSSLLAGVLTVTIGYYMPFTYASTVMMAIGAGMLTTFSIHTPSRQWIGYQIIFGFGTGSGFQQPLMAAQTVLPLSDVPTGTATILFFELLGGALLVSVSQSIFTNHLKSGLSKIAGVDAESVI